MPGRVGAVGRAQAVARLSTHCPLGRRGVGEGTRPGSCAPSWVLGGQTYVGLAFPYRLAGCGVPHRVLIIHRLESSGHLQKIIPVASIGPRLPSRISLTDYSSENLFYLDLWSKAYMTLPTLGKNSPFSV